MLKNIAYSNIYHSGIIHLMAGLKVSSALWEFLHWKGITKNFKSEVDELRKAGFYATNEFVEKLFREVGEGRKKHG